MDVSLSSYRDDANQIVDDISVSGSSIDRVVVLRNGDGTITVRGQMNDETQFEHDFEVSNRQYAGLTPLADDPITTFDDDLDAILSTVGFTIEPSNLTVTDNE